MHRYGLLLYKKNSSKHGHLLFPSWPRGFDSHHPLQQKWPLLGLFFVGIVVEESNASGTYSVQKRASDTFLARRRDSDRKGAGAIPITAPLFIKHDHQKGCQTFVGSLNEYHRSFILQYFWNHWIVFCQSLSWQ